MKLGIFILFLSVFMAGCASTLPPSSIKTIPPQSSILPPQGSSYRVQPGDTIWGIAHDFGWEVNKLASLNKLSSPRQLKVGQVLFVPPSPESRSFLWPVRGKVSTESSGSSVIPIRAPEGSIVRASKTGKVAVSANELSGWGKTVLLDHGDGYVSVYTGLGDIFVVPGAIIRQGSAIGTTSNSPIYFGIRLNAVAKNARAFLP